jgi:phage tail sheath protein FI
VIGTTTAEGTKTGMQALLAAQAQLGVKPKILGTPGRDTGRHRRACGDRQEAARFVYARALGATITEAIAYRANFSERELMLLMPDFLAWDTATSANVTSYAAAAPWACAR